MIIALCIYKKVTTTIQRGTRNDFLGLEHRLDLSARKSIYVIRAGNERFLIAADLERTSLLAKLNEPGREQNRETQIPSGEVRQVRTFDLEEDKIPVLKSLASKFEEQRR